MFSLKFVFVLLVLPALSAEARDFGAEGDIRRVRKEIDGSNRLLREGRGQLDTLSASGDFTLGELLYLINLPDELNVSKCTYSRQKLLERAIATGTASEYLQKLNEWLSKYCLSLAKISMQNGIDSLEGENNSLSNELFGKERKLTNEEEEQSNKIREKLDSLTGDEAEQILSADVVLEPNLVVELLKKIPSGKRLNNSIGWLGDLKFVAGLNPEECHKDNHYFIFGKAFEFEEYKQAPVVFMQNLAAKQNRVCNSQGTSLIEKVLVNKLKEETRQLIEEFAKEVRPEQKNMNGGLATFDRVMEALRLIAERKLASSQGGNAYELYGKQLAAACGEVRFEFRFSAKLLKTYSKASNLDLNKKWLDIVKFCRFVPEKLGSELTLNGEQNITNFYEEEGLELAKLLGVKSTTSQTELESVKKEKVLKAIGKYAKKIMRKNTSKTSPTFRVMFSIERNCKEDEHYKENLIWLAQNGYPIEDANKPVVLQTLSNMCKVLFSVGLDEISNYVTTKNG